MAELQLIGDVAAPAGATVTAVVTYLSDYRDEAGRVPPPAYRFKRLPNQGWQAEGGGPALVLGPDALGLPVPRVQVSYAVLIPGGVPLARTVERRVLPNTEAAGIWDFTLPDAQQPSWSGSGQPTPLEVLPGTGPQGEPGRGWFWGEGPPAGAPERPGDLHLDLLTWDVYRAQGGAWLLSGSLQGPAAPISTEQPLDPDGVAAMLHAGENIALDYDPIDRRLTVSAEVPPPLDAGDLAGMLTAGQNVTLNYDPTQNRVIINASGEGGGGGGGGSGTGEPTLHPGVPVILGAGKYLIPVPEGYGATLTLMGGPGLTASLTTPPWLEQGSDLPPPLISISPAPADAYWQGLHAIGLWRMTLSGSGITIARLRLTPYPWQIDYWTEAGALRLSVALQANFDTYTVHGEAAGESPGLTLIEFEVPDAGLETITATWSLPGAHTSRLERRGRYTPWNGRNHAAGSHSRSWPAEPGVYRLWLQGASGPVTASLDIGYSE